MEIIIVSDNGMELSTTIKAEAKRVVFAVLRDTLTNLSFADNASLEDFNEEFHSNITYSVMQNYKNKRYFDVTTAFRIISASAGYLWALENRKEGFNMKRKFYKPEKLKEIATVISAQPLTTSQSRTGVEKKVDPTEEEKRIVYNIVYSALLSFNHYCFDGSGRILPEKEQAVCNNAETTFDMFTDWRYNGYTSLYCKLKNILENWEVE